MTAPTPAQDMVMPTTRRPAAATAATFRRTLPPATAVAYVVAWAAGLSVFSSSTRVRASGQHVLASLRGHQVPATAQYVLTEGVTTVLLVLTVWPLWRLCAGRRRRALLVATTVGAAVVSFAELGLGVRLAAADLGPTSAGTLNEIIERLDGVKMLLLAAMLGVAALAVRRGALGTPRWFALASTFTGCTLALSGIGYLALDTTLATAAWLSLPALIATIVCAGIVARTHRGR